MIFCPIRKENLGLLYYFSDSPWHLTIGGYDGSAVLNSAELYNWKTGVQCFIEALPQVNVLKLFLKLQLINEIFQRQWVVILEH